MGVTRSASVALSALVAGCLGYAAHAEVAESPPARMESSERADMPVVQKAAVDPAAPAPVTPEASKPVPVTPEASKPAPVPAEAVAPVPEASPAPVAEAPAPPPVPSDPLAAAVAARLADSAPLLARLTTKDREAIQAFYALGAFKPVWIVDGAYTPAAKAAGARLAAAGEDGLKAAAYPVPVLGTQPLTEAQVAEAELKLSAAVVLYARDARGGRIHLPSLSRLITPTLDLPAADAVLGRIAPAGAQAGALLQAYNPSQPGYLALKARLAAARSGHGAAEPTVQLPAGPVLKLGMRDPRVPALRTRFALAAPTPGTRDDAADAYDAAVSAAVAGFQRRRGLPATGTLTQQTVAALGRPDSAPASDDAEAALIVNMERWRWLPADLGRDYVMVNIPEFQVRVFKDGRKRDEARVIVGKVESPTPIFSGLMEYAVVNPSWNVPPSILKNEFLPGLARDPNYAARRGYEVVYRNGTVSVRQPPGERNALGFIKFMFPNNHAVYLHDTPNRSLFSGSRRALSHGCVRVDDPFRFADAVLPEAWTGERLKKLIGKGERTVRLAEKLPVHLAYFTAYTDDAGAFRTLPDLYGYDARMKIALGLAPGSLLVAKASPPKAPALKVPKPAPTLATSDVAPTPRAATVSEPRRKPVREVRAAAPRPARTAARPPEEFSEPGLWEPVPPRPSAGWW